MLNVQAMTQTMSAMSLPQLQQYASLHKDDPYTVALALSIANQKKQAITAQQGQAGMQPMPKVVDQALAQMLPQAPQQMQPLQMPPPQMPPQQAAPRPAPMPEDVGIGQLPAPNIAKMAGGGIVAFGDGGEIPRYADQGLVELPEWVKRLPPDSLLRKFVESRLEGRAPLDIQAPKYTSAQPAQPAMPMGNNLGATDASLGAAGEAAAAQRSAPQPARSSATTPSTPAPPDQAASPYAVTTPSFKPGEGLGLASSPTTLRSELDAFMPQGQAKSPFEAQIRAAGQKELEGEEAYKTKREQQIKDLGVYGADQETRLRAREEKLKGQESELGPLALLQAGFAMMSGSSPFALQNIGIGAQTGLKHYAEGTERLQNAKEKLDDAFGRLETARRSEKMLTQKELAELERNVNKVKTQTEKEVLNAAQQAYGMDRGDARTLFQAYADQAKTRAELVSRERLGLAQIGAQERIAGQRNQLMQDLYGGENKARAEYGKLQKQVMADLSKNLLYVNEPNENKKQAMFNAEMQRAMQANPFLSSYAAGVGFTKAPPAGKIFDLTE